MATDRTQGLQPREARNMATTTEATRPGVLLTPPVDIFEDSDALTVLADMPGVKPGHLTIDLHEGVLTITGHAEPQQGSNEVAVVHEYPAGTFQRSFTLPEGVDAAHVEAKSVNGMLEVRVPAPRAATSRMIEVKAA